MLANTILALGALSLASASAPAPIIVGNPAGVSYQAILPDSKTTPIRGSVTGTSSTNGTGITFKVELSPLPAEGAPYRESSFSANSRAYLMSPSLSHS
jgi:hypothetical protein